MPDVPRDVGRRLQALTVKAGKRCSGSPNLSSDSGWTWNSMLARSCSGRIGRKRPAARAPWSSGPRRSSAYSSAISAAPEQRMVGLVQGPHAVDPEHRAQLQMVLQVARPRPAASCTTATPSSLQPGGRPDAGQLQQLRRADRRRREGSPRRASAPESWPPCRNRTPRRACPRTPPARPARRSPAAGWPGRAPASGSARAADQRRPRFWLTWK